MKKDLHDIYVQTMEHAASLPFYFGARAENLARKIPRLEGFERLQARFNYASDLLSSGETEQAIRQLQILEKEMKASPSEITTANRPLFDILALAYLPG